MRRSKSNPAKYARNYRKISQRKMTEQDGDDEQEDMDRLKDLLRNSSKHLSKYQNEDASMGENGSLHDGRKRKLSSKGADEESYGTKGKGGETTTKKGKAEIDECNVENIDEFGNDEQSKQMIDADGSVLDILPMRKKKEKKKPEIVLTPDEIRAARRKHKNLQRKLNQIEQRHEQKKRRTELYQTLSEHALSETEMKLMGKSSELGKRVSKKEALRKLLQKERAGVVLTEVEHDMLYTNTERKNEEDYKLMRSTEQVIDPIAANNSAGEKPINEDEVVPLSFSSSRKKKNRTKKKSSKQTNEDKTMKEGNIVDDVEEDINEETKQATEDKEDFLSTDVETKPSTVNDEKPKFSFAAQMMAGLSSLKSTAAEEKEKLDEKRMKDEAEHAEKVRREEEEERKKRKVYVPENTAILKSAAVMGLKPRTEDGKEGWRVLSVDRPSEVKDTRYDLPVSGMEYEIIDSVRNNSVTIICSETGSGKSTQVPQFLYESGTTLGNAKASGEDDGLLICVTQPRRVAAVSTAKRVCYEMGHSRDKGQSIQGRKGEGNLVAYQTKYETAGLGPKTRVKFMTDGILLQEIKSDLLLRKYAVICLDEIHERGINTDVLLGLLSAALPLRRKAAMEGSLPPLKLVLMSATLRVEDFTGDGKLFAEDPPNVVKVPGRTFPVTIHHSKTTELDDYEAAAFRKVCKIHRKLPQGGILVFLTGKQEIVRMVNRLRRVLIPKVERDKKSVAPEADVEVNGDIGALTNSSPRDMDDDEADGDLFRGDEMDQQDDFEDMENAEELEGVIDNDAESNIPTRVKILPLYSLLSVKDQAKIFEPIEEGTRLIVVSTNIAETSLTIPDVSYVVDTGRQKCRNYHAGTGVASYDIMWISKASANQRAGRAGRCGPGHCYRIYSSSVYSRHLDSYALPEVLTRPLEDVVLAMKSMNIDNVAGFPFPTPPDQSQINATVKLLANIGCIDISSIEEEGGDGTITRLGAAISQLPIGVRYGKMLLVSAQANALDFGIVMVSLLSEASPFANRNLEEKNDESESDSEDSLEGLDAIDRKNAEKQERQVRKERSNLWRHDGGDVLAGILATGAYSYAGRGAGGVSESLACKRFCEENALNPVIMQRIQKMRIHLAKLAKQRLGNAVGVAATTGKILATMSPPTKAQESLLRQAIASGLLDNIARRSPEARLGRDGTAIPRSAYFSCRSTISEPLFVDKKSVLFSRDPRQLPEWVCYDTLIRKNTKDGSTISTMINVTPIDPQWLGSLALGCKLLSIGEALDTPVPKYDVDRDSIMCSVVTKFGDEGWILPPIQVKIEDALKSDSKRIMIEDPYRWFARYLLEGKVFEELKDLRGMLNDNPAIITRKKPVSKIALLISSLSSNGISTAEALINHWAKKDSKFLFKNLKSWVVKEKSSEAKKLWISVVKKKILEWKDIQ